MFDFFKSLKNWTSRERDSAFLAGDDGRAASDLGIGTNDGVRLVNGREDVRERMTDMASRFGLAPSDIDRNRQTAVDVSLTCAECRNERTCRRYLAGKGSDDPHAFCPNADVYDELAAQAKAS